SSSPRTCSDISPCLTKWTSCQFAPAWVLQQNLHHPTPRSLPAECLPTFFAHPLLVLRSPRVLPVPPTASSVLSSYGDGTTSSGQVQLKKDLSLGQVSFAVFPPQAVSPPDSVSSYSCLSFG